jgi:hypothetical protein
VVSGRRQLLSVRLAAGSGRFAAGRTMQTIIGRRVQPDITDMG